MSDFTLTVAAHVSQQDPFRHWIVFSANQAESYGASRQRLRAAFLHTINALDTFNNSSSYLGSEAFNALSSLNHHLEVFHNYTAYTPINRQEGNRASTELVSALLHWRHPKKEARERIRVLVGAGRDIRKMQSLILEAQTLLATLQIGARSLRAVGSDAQGSEEPIQIEMTTRSLEIGCALMLSDLAETHLLD